MAEIILWMCPANDRWRYIVTLSLIGWAHRLNDPSDGESPSKHTAQSYIIKLVHTSYFYPARLQNSLHPPQIYYAKQTSYKYIKQPERNVWEIIPVKNWSNYFTCKSCPGFKDKMVAILQTTFSNAFSWMKIFWFQLKFHTSFYLWVHLIISHHWFR